MAYDNNLQDENAIQDLVARYIDAVNRIDKDAWAATWADDGSWELLGTEVSGKDNIVPFWVAAMGSFKYVIMMLNSGTVKINNDVATGRWYVTEHAVAKEGDAVMVLGVYNDCYRKVNDNWLFAERRYHILYRGSADLSGDYAPYPK